MAGRRVTLNEVARLSGVSVPLASVALSGNRGTTRVSEDTARRVREIAGSLHYRPTMAVRTIRDGRSYTLGAVTPTTNYGYSELWGGMMAATSDHGYQMMVALAKLHSEAYEEQVDQLLKRDVDGIILFSTAELQRSPIYQELRSRQRAVVFVENDPHDDFDFVGMDEVASYRLALKHLIAHGHERIAFAYEQEGAVPQAHQRRLDFEEVVDDFGLPVLPRFYFQLPSSAGGEQLESAVSKMLDSANPPTAMVVRGHRRAIRLHEVIQKRGLQIPRDFSMINLTMHSYEESRLQFDSVRHAVEGIAKTTINTLISRIDGESDGGAAKRYLLPGTLVPGETVAKRAQVSGRK